MKNRILLLLVGALTLGSLAIADIQAPPKAQWNWSRKLSRSLANLAYGYLEYPAVWQKNMRSDGSSAATTALVVDGTARTVVRVGYGLYELVTFPFPAYKGTYRPPYYKKERFDNWNGYQEFPPQLGMSAQMQYSRGQDN